MAPLLIYFIICGIIGMALWFNMLEIIKTKFGHVNDSFVTPRQYFVFLDIVKKESDKKLRRKYKNIFWWQIALLPIFLVGEMILLSIFLL
jgi:hypothetical protein